ncbi:DUF7847 domain-containing protein [Streptomyces jeddahensis]|uniref:DUF7847 domain-containing protein n=1 Tax=Streptomyces jeddahensis TaxID=1716141 RepID=UPI0012FF748D|nr:hypothetical protein [Streptomyces jeddahensis]
MAPLGLEAVFGGVFATLRHYAKPLLGSALAAYAALTVLLAGLFALSYVAMEDHLDAVYTPGADVEWDDIRPILTAFGVVWAVGGIATIAVTAFVQASCTATLREAVLGRRTTVSAVARHALSRTPAVLGIMLLMALIVLVPTALIAAATIGLFVAALSMDSGPALWAGPLFLLFLLTVPLAIWLYVLFGFAPAAAVLESAGPLTALRRSARLVRGAWWRIFGITLLGVLMVLVASLVVQMPLMFAAPASAPYSPADPSPQLSDFLPHMDVYLVLSMLVNLLVQLLTAVFLPLVTTLLYVDQRIRKEGLATALAAAAARPPA